METMSIMTEITRLTTNARMSQAVIHGGVAYLAGQVATDRQASLRVQTEEVLAKIDALLEQSGSDRSRILTATIWLTDMADFAAMNEVWEAWMPQGAAPARATVTANLAHPALRIEIGVIAACK